MIEFKANDLLILLPEIALAIFAMIMLIFGAFKGNKSTSAQIRFSVFGLSLILLVLLFTPFVQSADNIFKNMFISNDFTRFIKILLVISTILVLLLCLSYFRQHQNQKISEFPTLVLLSVVGMMLMVSANSLLSLYMGLELQSLALYVLASINRDNAKSSEAGLKYFVLGSVSSGILLYGCSLIYGFSGTINFEALAQLYTNAENLTIGALIGIVLVIVGLCFKISAVPFHMWTPDVYEGSPTQVTAMFAIAPKIAAIALFVRFALEPFGNIVFQWQQVIIFVSAASMIIGSLGALKQTNIKRLLAYSSIGHMGYILMGLAAASEEGIQAILLYLCIYIVMSLGIFACVMIMKNRNGHTEEISDLAGISKSKPLFAVIIAILMLSMAGIPPFAGFFAKFFIFTAAINQGLFILTVIAALSSVVAAYYYLKIIKIMYFDEQIVPFKGAFEVETRLISITSAAFNQLNN